MHASVMQFLRDSVFREDVEGKCVLEVGSLNVNGSPREVIEPLKPASYTGIDFQSGRGVDIVMDASDPDSLANGTTFDVVVSTEMLEHAQNWRGAVSFMKRALAPLGLLVVTARGPGFPRHGFPYDYWRFTFGDFQRIFEDMEPEVIMTDPEYPGVFLKCRKPGDWKEIDLSGISLLTAPPS